MDHTAVGNLHLFVSPHPPGNLGGGKVVERRDWIGGVDLDGTGGKPWPVMGQGAARGPWLPEPHGGRPEA